MTQFLQNRLGRCDFLDVLEESVLRHQPVEMKLRDGQVFVDEVVDVVTERGDDFAVFRSHDRVPVGEIISLTWAELPVAR